MIPMLDLPLKVRLSLIEYPPKLVPFAHAPWP